MENSSVFTPQFQRKALCSYDCLTAAETEARTNEVNQIQKSNTFLPMGHETLLTGVVGEYGWDPPALIVYKTAFRHPIPIAIGNFHRMIKPLYKGLMD
ncbi:hypothetical protein E5288_WYG000231 [Bos mutus]|uniref:Uncharacterized protein n=1 Tax=Bos mutus TaxID=72004 RepID=A0A6B0QUN2_9CETA|nr:hypothetical protein [Bos mutus]